jgi:hypothetical protein
MRSYDIQSWVITDVGRDAPLKVSGDSITVQVSPYFYFWKSDLTAAKPIIQEYQRLSFMKGLLNEYPSSSKRLSELNDKISSLKKRLENFQPSVVELREPQKAVEAKAASMRQLAPPVFDALANTCQYAALFRLVKSRDQGSWNSFYKIVTSVPLQPIEVPNMWPRPD